jgi:steroid delta-isomerase-like uncharacterized protein
MSQSNKDIARAYLEQVWNRWQFDRFDEFVAEDVVFHDRSGDQGRAWMKETLAALREAFPDEQTTIEDEIAEGDRVVQRFTTTATHQGEFNGIPATGKRIVLPSIYIFRLADGKIVEVWAQTDGLTMMQQLGVIPAPAEVAGA